MGFRLGLTGLVAMLAVGQVHADPNPEAEKLFRDGRALIKDGKLDEGCNAFAASSRLEPSVGTLLNLGDCRAKLGQTASAWAAFTEAANLAKRQHDKRQAEADRRVKDVEAKLSYITVQIEAAAHVPGLKVTRNGAAVDEAIFGRAMPVDPGDYEIHANVGDVEFSTHAKLGPDGDRKTVIVKLHLHEPAAAEVTPPKPAPAKLAPAPLPKPDTEASSDEPEHATPSTFTPMRAGAVVAAGGGVIALGVSVALSLQAKSLYDQAHTVCPQSPCGDMAASQKSRDAVTKGNIATIIGGVGIAAIGVGITLWFVGKPHEDQPTRDARIVPIVSRDDVGVSIVGRF